MELPKQYIPKEYELGVYKKWEESGFFNPDNLATGEGAPAFTIAMPPPNATGVLHVGHTLGITIQDIMIRYHRMRGEQTLMLPGADHAAIATQNMVEKMLRKEGLSRYKLGREEFLRQTQEYVEKNKETINNQTKRMGASADWSRLAYTLSPKLNRVVAWQFKKMFEDGLIYRGERIVNWCSRCHSTLADDEVEYQEQTGKLWTFKYSRDFPIVIATTRPETKLGDTAVAVNPDDQRYQKYIGQVFDIDFVGVPLKIKIITDRKVAMDFGTGAVGVTPAHSFVDWEMAVNNKLAIKKVIGQDGKIMPGFGDYTGLKIKEAREKIIESLQKEGLIGKEEEIKNNISLCYRCNAEIEPLPSLQWFIAVDKKFDLTNKELIKQFGEKQTTLKEISLWAVKAGMIKIIPEHFKKVYFNWMENLHDWCISRQIWFGHQIPVYYNSLKHEYFKTLKQTTNLKSKIKNQKYNEEIYVGIHPPKGKDWAQDEDTLDTWFSSALWTWSTLLEKKDYKKYDSLEEWLKNSPDLKKFHPTNVMETMHDILFFWVGRMIMMTLYALNEVPFKTVYLHGMVQDEKGRKMSKSYPETCIEPIEVSEKYGTDALRLSLIMGTTPGTPLKLSEQKIAGQRNFANKLWNIGRFIQLTNNNYQLTKDNNIKPLTLADKWIVSRLNNLIKEVTNDLDNFRFGQAVEKLYEFTWHELADWYVEIAKIQNDENTRNLLFNIYNLLLKLLHPFTPFVTEKIWEFFQPVKILMVEAWPKADENLIDAAAEEKIVLIKNIITAIRAKRKEKQLKPKDIIKLQLAGGKLTVEEIDLINKLARVEIQIAAGLDKFDLEIGDIKMKF